MLCSESDDLAAQFRIFEATPVDMEEVRVILVGEPRGACRRAGVEDLRQFEEPIEGTRVALERLLPQPQQDGMLRRHPPRPSLFIEPDGNLERPFDIAAKIAVAFLLAARVARSARLEPAVLRRLVISDREAVIGGLVCHEIAPLSLRVCASIVRDAAPTGRDPLSGQAVALSALTAVLPVTFCQRLIVTST